ncbi:amidase domain-containing protein [Cryobacterium sp. Sr8]|uniref:amidase domain-containing protein n=1 Tax=Cryobacterium sp. Sr8 TaxID=1259203 RepID=UPI00141B1440|nr:amidase domain-containing protein [Cryobacterium sp. Sr8]
MALSRPIRIGLVALAVGGLIAGAAALTSVVVAQDSPSAGRAATSVPTDTATPRATPDSPNAPVPVDLAVQKQLAYALAHWKNYNVADYGVVTGNDCVNFTNQSLIARGWEMDAEWRTAGTGSSFSFSKPWVSSTALMRYLADSGRATALTDAQRDQVKLGDVVQFDWDKSGDRDHTGIVTRVEKTAAGVQIYYAGHTDDSDYLSVDYAITTKHPGGRAYYWSIP